MAEDTLAMHAGWHAPVLHCIVHMDAGSGTTFAGVTGVCRFQTCPAALPRHVPGPVPRLTQSMLAWPVWCPHP